MTTYLLAGFLLLGVFSLAALVLAVARAKDGYENESGFHLFDQTQPTGLASVWNHIEEVYYSTVDAEEEARSWNWEQYQESECDRASRAPYPPSFV